MQFIVVASEDLAGVARQFLHNLSLRSGHSGAFWPLTRYADNEAQLNSKQPVIFLGEDEISGCYIDMLPERFRGYGARCCFGGTKAVLVVDTPDWVSPSDLRHLRNKVQGVSSSDDAYAGDDFSRGFQYSRAATAASAGVLGGVLGLGLLGAVAVPVAAWIAAPGLYEGFSSYKWKEEYRQLQFQYVLQRFLEEEFDAFVGGIEAQG